MDKLWAPWRSRYIYTRFHKGCIFCDKPKQNKDTDNYVITRKRYSFSMLNMYPYNNGHIMVVPYRHVKDLNGLKDEEVLDMMLLVRDTEHLLNRVIKPEGYNIGINLGRASGAGVSGHIHIHIVPRWNGDTNFMPVLNETKVISESLRELYRRLKDAD